MQRLRIVLIVALLSSCPTVVALAEDIDDPCPVPAPLIATGHFRADFTRLAGEADRLDRNATAFNARCGTPHDRASKEAQACLYQFTPLAEVITRHNAAVHTYNRGVLASVDRELALVTERLQTTRGKIATELHASAKFQADADRWVEMTERERKLLAINSAFGLFEGVASRVETIAHEDIEFTTEQRERMQTWYQSYGQAFPAADAARLKEQIFALHTHKGLAMLLGWLAQTGSRATNLSAPLQEDHRVEAMGQALVGLLKVVGTITELDPELRALVGTVELSIENAYAFTLFYAANTNLDVLNTARGLSARAIDSLGRMYKRDVDRLKVLKAARASAASQCTVSG